MPRRCWRRRLRHRRGRGRRTARQQPEEHECRHHNAQVQEHHPTALGDLTGPHGLGTNEADNEEHKRRAENKKQRGNPPAGMMTDDVEWEKRRSKAL